MQLTDVGITGGRLDTAVARGFALLADGWRRLTGKSHFLLARILIVVSASCDVAYLATRKMVFMTVFTMLMAVVFYSYAWWTVRYFEAQHNSLSDVLPAKLLREAGYVQLLRWFALGNSIYDLFHLNQPTWIMSDLAIAAIFFLVTLVGQPPAKAWWTYVVDSFKQHGLRPIHV